MSFIILQQGSLLSWHIDEAHFPVHAWRLSKRRRDAAAAAAERNTTRDKLLIARVGNKFGRKYISRMTCPNGVEQLKSFSRPYVLCVLCDHKPLNVAEPKK
jgi:hypothetical protein